MKPLIIQFRQNVSVEDGELYTAPRVTACKYAESVWMKYVGMNRFLATNEADLMDPKTIPAIYCPLVINGIGWASAHYVCLYFKGIIFLFDPFVRTVSVMDDKKTHDRIVEAASNGKIRYKADLEIIVRGVNVENINYLDVI